MSEGFHGWTSTNQGPTGSHNPKGLTGSHNLEGPPGSHNPKGLSESHNLEGSAGVHKPVPSNGCNELSRGLATSRATLRRCINPGSTRVKLFRLWSWRHAVRKALGWRTRRCATRRGSCLNTLSTLRGGVSAASASELKPLRNPANLCFVNASCQALLCLPRVQTELTDMVATPVQQPASSWRFGERNAGVRNGACPPDFDAMWHRTFQEMRGAADSSPIMLRELSSLFYNGQQEDAHEFLTVAMDLDFAPRLGRLLRYRVDEQLTCMSPTCVGQRVTGEAATPADTGMQCLMLELLSRRNVLMTSVKGALAEHFQKELLHDYRWECPLACGCHAAERQQVLINHPDVLWIQLRRWKWDETANVARLLGHRVRIDDVLEVHGVWYKLHSFVVHIGDSPDSGHYVACTRATAGNGWVVRDDAQQTVLSVSQLQDGWAAGGAGKVYMLFYQKEHGMSGSERTAGTNATEDQAGVHERTTETAFGDDNGRHHTQPATTSAARSTTSKPQEDAEPSKCKSRRWANGVLKATFCKSFGTKKDSECTDEACSALQQCPSAAMPDAIPQRVSAEGDSRKPTFHALENRMPPTMAKTTTPTKRRRLSRKTTTVGKDHQLQSPVPQLPETIVKEPIVESGVCGDFFRRSSGSRVAGSTSETRETSGRYG